MKNFFSALDPELIYLNHGSFGATPLPVQQAQQAWRERLQRNPMRFLARDQEFVIAEATQQLATFLHCDARDLLLAENATWGMNLIARSFPLSAGDEILITNHEYGAVKRIWQQTAKAVGAKVVTVFLPEDFHDEDQVAEAIVAQATPRAKIMIVSHVTSPTAIVLPVKEICQKLQSKGIAVCIDGPHAIGMRELNLSELGCDFYTASCHKWLSAPLGSGFLYVQPHWQHRLQPMLYSWGGPMSDREKNWKDEFLWMGTRDLSAQLSIPEAIRFLEDYGLDRFRQETHKLAAYAVEKFKTHFSTSPLVPDDIRWYGSMVTLPLPEQVWVPENWTGTAHPLQILLAEKYRIEIPLVKWGKRMHIRVSCHLYNSQSQIDQLCDVLQTEISAS